MTVLFRFTCNKHNTNEMAVLFAIIRETEHLKICPFSLSYIREANNHEMAFVFWLVDRLEAEHYKSVLLFWLVYDKQNSVLTSEK